MIKDRIKGALLAGVLAFIMLLIIPMGMLYLWCFIYDSIEYQPYIKWHVGISIFISFFGFYYGYNHFMNSTLKFKCYHCGHEVDLGLLGGNTKAAMNTKIKSVLFNEFQSFCVKCGAEVSLTGEKA